MPPISAHRSVRLASANANALSARWRIKWRSGWPTWLADHEDLDAEAVPALATRVLHIFIGSIQQEQLRSAAATGAGSVPSAWRTGCGAAKDMAAWDHGGGFSVEASVGTATDDRPALERLQSGLGLPILGSASPRPTTMQ